MADHAHAHAHAPRPLGGVLLTPFTLLLGVLSLAAPGLAHAHLAARGGSAAVFSPNL